MLKVGFAVIFFGIFSTISTADDYGVAAMDKTHEQKKRASDIHQNFGASSPSTEEASFRNRVFAPKEVALNTDPATEKLKTWKAAFEAGSAPAQSFAEKDLSVAVECFEPLEENKTTRNFAGLMHFYKTDPTGHAVLFKSFENADTLEKLNKLSEEQIRRNRLVNYKIDKETGFMRPEEPVKNGSLRFSGNSIDYQMRSVKDPETGKKTVMIKVTRFERRVVWPPPMTYEGRYYSSPVEDYPVSEAYCL